MIAIESKSIDLETTQGKTESDDDPFWKAGEIEEKWG